MPQCVPGMCTQPGAEAPVYSVVAHPAHLCVCVCSLIKFCGLVEVDQMRAGKTFCCVTGAWGGVKYKCI